MRSIILAVLVAAGIGLIGIPTGSAAPVSGISPGGSVGAAGDLTAAVQYRRRWRNRRWRGLQRCRVRCNADGRCWRVCW